MSEVWDLVHMAAVLMLPVMVPIAILLFIHMLRRRSKAKRRFPANTPKTPSQTAGA